MATPILMPRQGQSVESCILTGWKVRAGDPVKTGQPVASIETDKATFEVESPADGIVLELFFQEGDDIPVLTHIAAVGRAGEDASTLRPGTRASAAATQPNPAAAPPSGATPVVSSTPSAPADGSVSPRARRAAAAAGLDPDRLAGSGPGGRVIERDVMAARATSPHLSASARAARADGAGEAPRRGSGPGGMVLAEDLEDTGRGSQLETPLKGVRKIIAERMRQSLGTTAQLTLTMSFDVAGVQRRRAAAKARGERVTINDLIVWATAQTLKQHPALNAHFLGDRIAQFASIHMGIAVDTPRGLMVPVLKHAEQLSVEQISAQVRPLAEACLAGSISPDMLSGGTFTITNLGTLGVETFTPVLNAPEVAILGVGGLQLKPVKKGKDITFVEAITLSLTIDHQAVDGAPAARFLKDLCEALENVKD